MADLTNKTPLDTYKSLLNVGTADNQELDTTLRIVEDGAGNDSDLKIATNKVRINTKLGIGKDPNYGLDVLTTSAISGIFDNNQDTNMISIQDQDTTSITHVGVGAQDDDFFVRAGNGEKFRISSTGDSTLSGDLTINAPASKLLFRGDDTSVNHEIESDGNLYITVDDDNDNTTNFIQFRANGATDLMKIQDDGKVGIGTSSPDTLLHVMGETSIQPVNYANDQDKFLIKGGASNNDAWDGHVGIKMKSDGSGVPYLTLRATNNDTLNVISSKVGIGTASPDAPLTVKSTAASTCLKLLSSDSDAAAGPNLTLQRYSSSPADNDVLGKVQFFGRNDNTQDVEYAAIYGQLMDASDSSEDGKIRMYVKQNGTDKGALDLNSTSAIFNYSAADIDFRVYSENNSNMFFVDAAQDNVGIGAAPNSSYTFDLTRTTAGYAQRIYNSSTASESHGLLITAGKDEEHASHPLFIENQAGDDLLKITAKGTMSLGGNVNSNEYMIYAKARPGVDSRILLDGSGNTAESNISIQNKYGNRFCWISSADEGSSNSGIKFGTGNAGTPSERMRIDKDGKVGIGTTNPAADLHINNSSAEPTILLTGPGSNPADAARIRFSEQSDGNNYIELKYDGSSNTLSFDSNDQADMLSVDRTNNRVFTGTSTKVGVGTSAPATTLDVRGSVSVGQGSEVTIASGVITVTDSYHKVDTEGDASSDNLDTINGGQIGQMLFLRQVDSGRDVVLTESGNIILPGSTFTLSNAADLCLLLYTGANWQMVSTSDNA